MRQRDSPFVSFPYIRDKREVRALCGNAGVLLVLDAPRGVIVQVGEEGVGGLLDVELGHVGMRALAEKRPVDRLTTNEPHPVGVICRNSLQRRSGGVNANDALWQHRGVVGDHDVSPSLEGLRGSLRVFLPMTTVSPMVSSTNRCMSTLLWDKKRALVANTPVTAHSNDCVH